MLYTVVFLTLEQVYIVYIIADTLFYFLKSLFYFLAFWILEWRKKRASHTKLEQY